MGPSLDISKAKSHTANHSKQVHAIWPDVTFCTIVHRRGQRADEAEIIFSGMRNHPAYDAVRQLWRGRGAGSENSAFIGLALGRSKGFMGFGQKDSLVSVITFNIDQYEHESDALFDLYHLTGQAVELIEFYKNSSRQENLRQGPLRAKRNQLGESRANLRADIFSAMMMAANGFKDAPSYLARKRGIESLSASALHMPENYPYPLATETTQYAVEKFLSKDGGERSLKSAHRLALNVTKTFDENNIKTWWDFVNPCQAMAWTGQPMENILGAAVHTCPDPFIKATGYLVSEITHTPPSSGTNLGHIGYNPFVSIEINRLNHERSVDDTFEMALAHGIEAESSLPLLKYANMQNEALTSGKIMGWCAVALQSAAKAFDTAKMRGLPADRAARLEFQGTRTQTDWETLYRIHGHVTQERRNGYAVTLPDLEVFCDNDPAFKPVLESVGMTLKDPAYTQKLSAMHEISRPAPRAAPSVAPTASLNVAPSAALHAAPQATIGGIGGGMSGGGNISNGHTTHRTVASIKKRIEEDALQFSDDEDKK